MTEISRNSHNVVMVDSEDGPVPCVENNNLLLMEISTMEYLYVPLTAEVCQEFNLTVEDDNNIHSTDNIQNMDNNNTIKVGNGKCSGHSSFEWTAQLTMLLLEEYKEKLSMFRSIRIKNKTVWGEIENKFNRMGYFITADQLDKKFRNLKQRYLHIKDNNNSKRTTGRGRISWPYYNIMQEIFVDDKAINPSYTISSLPSTSSITSNVTRTSSSAAISTTPPATGLTSPSARVFTPLPATATNLMLNADLTHTLSPTAAFNQVENEVPTEQEIHSTRVRNNRSRPKRERKTLDSYRKKMVEIEEEKLNEAKRLRSEVQTNNTLLKERNDILRDLLKKL